MRVNSLRELFIDEISDLYDAEQQLVKALPKMAEAANHAELEQAIRMHLQETEGHVERLERIFTQLGERAKGKTCKAMKGLVEEGKERIKSDGDECVIDAGIIAAAQRVEHYEIAGYGCARTYAQLLGETEAAQLLEQTLDEEKAADHKLTDLAETIVNPEAAASSI